jgi:Holliday junction resolvase
MMLAAKIDANQFDIVSDLRKAGALVLSLAGVGRGCPDLLVSYGGKVTLLEVKAPKRSRLTKGQVEFHSVWPVQIVHNTTEALRAIGAVVQDSEI